MVNSNLGTRAPLERVNGIFAKIRELIFSLDHGCFRFDNVSRLSGAGVLWLGWALGHRSLKALDLLPGEHGPEDHDQSKSQEEGHGKEEDSENGSEEAFPASEDKESDEAHEEPPRQLKVEALLAHR